ncbi:N-acetylneuraminate synthase [Nonlabens sp. Ci31]|jgi:N,N'-diacetyllegionaminate synthase|uniref:N-acetylneuraminate synthase n=1 Tax=Nonlabens sp. Ci31 TaxID=2608253 RepID=UPI001464742C|nr:N-acetylneuraminate synthase [Nonlabens sp. Ci31]QJP34907.1 N-acetylneuraminate synthase [Nonlabens sp. Ci31]
MNRTLIIAEAGVNHNGDIQMAKQLVNAAAAAKVDYVKFQTFKADKLVTKKSKKADYQIINTADGDPSQYNMLKALELTDEMHDELIAYCKTKDVKFLSTGFDQDSLAYLKDKGITLAKIPSGELTNLPYLRTVANLFQDVILSTGMATLSEVKEAYNILLDNGVSRNRITILHCNTEYPTPMVDVNLLGMLDIKEKLNCSVGYSDHTLGIEVPIAATALGAVVIEKHFTLDRNLPGPDHKASLEPDELKQMVQSIRNIETALSGSGVKEPSPSELKNKPIARKSIVAILPIEQGETFTLHNIGVKRPGTGISPMKWDEVLGSSALKSFNIDDLIEL